MFQPLECLDPEKFVQYIQYGEAALCRFERNAIVHIAVNPDCRCDLIFYKVINRNPTSGLYEVGIYLGPSENHWDKESFSPQIHRFLSPEKHSGLKQIYGYYMDLVKNHGFVA